MADVYLALDTILNREVAIKILKDEMANDKIALERFAREAKASARLIHPNIVEIYDVGDEGNKHYIVMEYIKGYTLKKLLDIRGAIPYKESVWMIKQLALALLEAHKKGIIHRDVKSQNVLIKYDGTIKMGDFGIAQATNDIKITKHDTILGSVHYLAPELTKGRKATMQSDIYSLGVVLYELLTGDVPFRGESAVSIALQHVNQKIPSVRAYNSEIPQSVENIITKATAKNLENRYENVAYLIKDLNECLLPEHANDDKLVFKDRKDGTETLELVDELKEKENDLKKKGIFSKGLGVFTLCILGIASAAAVTAVLLLSGVFSLPGDSKYVKVPNIEGMSINDAQDKLDEYDLKIDYSSIERIMTDSTPEGVVISFEPGVNHEVYKQSEIKLVVSDGVYQEVKDYTNKKKDEIIDELKELNIAYTFKKVDSEKEPGIIINQSIEPGSKYNPKKGISIDFDISKEAEILIQNIKGLDIETAQRTLEEEGATVELIQQAKSEFIKEDVEKYNKPFTVVKVEPVEGSTYTQTEGKTIKLYYYTETEEDENKNSETNIEENNNKEEEKQ